MEKSTQDPEPSAKRYRWTQKYRKEWVSDADFVRWLRQSKHQPFMATFTLCNKELRYESGGLRQLRNLALSSEHMSRKRPREGGICSDVQEAVLLMNHSSLRVRSNTSSRTRVVGGGGAKFYSV